jgi:hypothetical protein
MDAKATYVYENYRSRLGAWVALLVAIVFFILGFAWYYGQTLLRRYLHCYAQTTALQQLPHRLGFASDTTEPERQVSLTYEHHGASSDDDEDADEKTAKPMINILPPTNGYSNGNGLAIEDHIALTENSDEPRFRTSLTGNVVFTVTPGLGVFLTTSSRHTPHVFERVLAHIHAVRRTHSQLRLFHVDVRSF